MCKLNILFKLTCRLHNSRIRWKHRDIATNGIRTSNMYKTIDNTLSTVDG